MSKKKAVRLVVGLVVLLGLGTVLMAANAPAKIENGKKVTLSYRLFVDGELIETADTKAPFIYTQGKNEIVPGLEKGLVGLRVGDKKTIQVAAQEAYGMSNPTALKEFEKEKFPKEVSLKKGTLVEARSPEGERMLVKIHEVKEKTVVLDFNHPLAGKNLEFRIEVLSIA